MGGIRKFKKRQRPQRPRDQRPDGGYKQIPRENKLFEEFYRVQKICPDEEFDKMMEAYRADLPASFRVTGFKSQALALKNVIESTYFKELTALSAEKQLVQPKSLEWYPESMAWQLNVTRNDIRREEAYFKLHNFLISETESGNISRQETVSMIPPIVLDVQPHHKVLDMCAAPGSKTAQLIERIHAVEDVVPEGFVVANDSDNSRCYMLVHQAKRLQSPCVIIMNHDASILPSMQITKKDGAKTNLKFDRILCDVPCTGDGTLRKNPDIWPKWNPSNACNLHGIQYRILKRGLELLAVGGRLVYSTCSLNPLEDEAVLYRMLLETEDTVEISDCSSLVPGLRYRKGVSTWTVASKENKFFDEWEQVPEALRTCIRPHMFPPKPEEAEKFHLDRCLRVLPHLQNTGGFFVAVLHKKAPCPWENKAQYEEGHVIEQTKQEPSETEEKREPPKKRGRYQGFREDPYMYFNDEEPAFTEIKKYFDIKDLTANMFLTRCRDTSKKNSLYFTSLNVRDIITSNSEKVKFINTGVKAFAKCENKGAMCEFRLAQEGALMTIPFLRDRIVTPTKSDLVTLLTCDDTDRPTDLEVMDPDTLRQLNGFDTGCIALVYKETDSSPGLKVELVGWKGKASVRAYVPKNERIHYLRLLGGDTSKFEKNKYEAKRAAGNGNVQEEGETKEEERKFELEVMG